MSLSLSPSSCEHYEISLTLAHTPHTHYAQMKEISRLLNLHAHGARTLWDYVNQLNPNIIKERRIELAIEQFILERTALLDLVQHHLLFTLHHHMEIQDAYTNFVVRHVRELIKRNWVKCLCKSIRFVLATKAECRTYEFRWTDLRRLALCLFQLCRTVQLNEDQINECIDVACLCTREYAKQIEVCCSTESTLSINCDVHCCVTFLLSFSLCGARACV